MGSRGRSIRLRIYFLVAIPLITMLGLFAYVAYTSTTTYLNLDRAPNLINATAEPLTNFVNKLQAERRAAVVYASHPSAANLGVPQGDREHDRGRGSGQCRAQLGRDQEQRVHRRDERHRVDDLGPRQPAPAAGRDPGREAAR